MSAVSFRDAGVDDASALADLGRRTFVETFGHLYARNDLDAFLLTHNEPGWREQLADPAFAIRVAEAEGALVAYAKLGPTSLPFEPRGAAIELRQFYVLKPWQGEGIAPELMTWTIAWAKARGAEELYLSVFVDNHRARRFYERYGFEFVGVYAFMVGTHADEDHVMRLDLRGAR
ncbi:MAG TPA: GNAT family N-acetyltransferase [Allosphingosinicella sp.]|jgi:GNAT superfamily N-acetyltransferase